MAAGHDTILYDVHDCKVYALLTDGVGASPTYGAAVDVPGIAKAALDPNLVTASLKGDATTIARRGRVDSWKGSLLYGKLALDVLAVVLGGSVTDAGAGSAETATWDSLGPAALPYFKVEFKIDDVDVDLATAHFMAFKAQVAGGTIVSGETDKFNQPTLEFEGIQPEHLTTPMVRVRLLETATALSA